MEGLVRILAAFLSTTVFAALLGLGLAIASRKLKVEKDEKVESLNNLLPGLNCGACGYAGCEAYAEALASESDSDISRCGPGGDDTKTNLGKLLGLESDDSAVRMVARLACLGTDQVAIKEFQYLGYPDCESAHMHFDGDKGCKYGCLGLGSCVKSCPVDAIEYTGDGLVRVDPVKCIGCEICVAVCPTGVMKMIPADADWFVACNSKDKAKITKGLCTAGCIGCRICERKFPEAGYVVTDNLSVLGYNKERGEGRGVAATACPPKCIIQIAKVKED
ncbi:MAG: RnfABCDGE type electron transport complex subunit B [Spirochaetaceae bacterium]|nr:RnfABCDGE type electron transport complex subunit B [Spirochaetaceae bacterium]